MPLSRLEAIEAILSQAGTPPLLVRVTAESIDKIYQGEKGPSVAKEPDYSIVRENGAWFCDEWFWKDKYSEPQRRRIMVPLEDVNFLWDIIYNTWALPLYPLADNPKKISPERKWKLPGIARLIIERLALQIPIASFNGGKYRGLYFKHYLYPARVLDFEKKIRFGNVSWRLK